MNKKLNFFMYIFLFLSGFFTFYLFGDSCDCSQFAFNSSLCGSYYPFVIEDFATGTFFYYDSDLVRHSGFIPNITTDKPFNRCVDFLYSNKVVVS